MRAIDKNAGQILPLILFVLTVSAILMVVMFNTGQKTIDKSIATNAADAGAYSAGVWVSRNLNYLAYTNRAMVANHVAIGHLITYVSWIRYVEQVAEKIDDIGQFIPYVAQVTAAIEQAAEYLVEAAEIGADVMVPSVDVMNGLIYASQLAALSDLQPSVVDQVMADVVRTYDSQLEVNNPSGLKGAGSDFTPLIQAALLSQGAALAGAAEVMTPGKDSGQMHDLVSMSYAGATNWFNNRKWSRRFLFFFKLRKEASTSHSEGSSLSSWEAEDSMEFGQYRFRKGRWEWVWDTIGEGDASTGEFSDSYQGIHGYTKFSGAAWQKESDALYMDLVTLAAKSDRLTVPNRRMDLGANDTSISGFGRARVYFEKPTSGFSGHATEHANLLNPFWQVKLVSPW